jgi:hypothetical protein
MLDPELLGEVRQQGARQSNAISGVTRKAHSVPRKRRRADSDDEYSAFEAEDALDQVRQTTRRRSTYPVDPSSSGSYGVMVPQNEQSYSPNAQSYARSQTGPQYPDTVDFQAGSPENGLVPYTPQDATPEQNTALQPCYHHLTDPQVSMTNYYSYPASLDFSNIVDAQSLDMRVALDPSLSDGHFVCLATEGQSDLFDSYKGHQNPPLFIPNIDLDTSVGITSVSDGNHSDAHDFCE